jgi:hypothetical protein
MEHVHEWRFCTPLRVRSRGGDRCFNTLTRETGSHCRPRKTGRVDPALRLVDNLFTNHGGEVCIREARGAIAAGRAWRRE